jgi:coproporphyrinogen III oxidase
MKHSQTSESVPEQSIQTRQERAAGWFRELRDLICAEFEALEGVSAGTYSDRQAGRFERKAWTREEGGGGEMSIMRGRVFEKVGVNISTVHGEFSDLMRKEVPGAKENPQFWASGISVVAHMQSPLVPAVHMNTRMLVLGDGKKHWYGGGADLTPMMNNDEDAAEFHAAFRACCNRFSPDYYAKYKQWCDEYFYIKHRGEPRGAGGIFYDYLDSGDGEKDFFFTRSVGETFLSVYPKIIRRHMNSPWTKAQREQQLVRRGRYVEFNLLYDRGTRFGLQTGGNPEAILMSLPPEVRWP